jgi:hypothetical protein
VTACTRCETALEDGDLRCAICALPAPAPAVEPTRHAQCLRCHDCGAAVAYSGAARAPRCGFCGATMAIEQPVDPLEAARVRVPLTVGRDAAEAALRGWLARRGWFAPPALSRDAVLESLTPIAWAAWRVTADARVTWAADSDHGADRSAWAPHAGEAELAFRDILVPASRGLRGAECRQLAARYDLTRAIAVDAPAAADEHAATVEQFDAQRSAARSVVQDRIADAARVRIQPRIPGRRHRNIHVACLIERQATERIALPAWVLAYRFRGRPYRAIVHGQDADLVIGRAPLDAWKVTRLVAVLAALAALVIFAISRA